MDKILWVDLEMSGLDVEKEVIIEVAAIVTDHKMTPQDQYHSVVKQPQKYIENMDEWNKTHHGRSGLIDKIPRGNDPADVEEDLISFVKKHFPNEKPVLAGNSINQDRIFINKYMPKLASMLHYRMLDVSSWKLVFKFMYNMRFEKTETHQAMDDIKESIAEMKYYLEFINVKKGSK